MSRTIDERVVSMQFDNKQFENNVKTSMSTLEKLKQSLNFKGLSKGLEGLNSSVKKVDMSPLGGAAQTVGLKFSAMYTMADQALRNITTRAQQTAESMIKAFTIDPVKTGMAEYETQIGAVQTILANTQSKGSTLLDVNAALDELNTYADKTIYNFTEMTRNIGTFTAAGVDLDKSVSSIKGIANLAAVSGSTSQQASTAMYQLSQALAAGKVQLMDWNSVVNAGMGGQLFQDALKRTAKQMGHNVDEMIEKYGSFRESLTQGEWLTAEVLTETLTQLSGAYTEAELIAQGYSEKQAKEITELADTAVNAATKVKTFSQLMDTLKEAAQSGWTQTWEIIVGDFEEAKELWTNVSDIFGGIIGASAEARNELLSGALDTNWEKLIKKINAAGIETSTFEERIKGVLKEHGHDVDKLVEKHGSLEKAFRSGAVSSDILKEAVNGIGESVKKIDLSSIERELKRGMNGDDVKKMQEALEMLNFDIGEKGLDGKFGPDTQAALKAFQELNGLKPSGILDPETQALLQDQLTETASVADGLGESVFSLIDNIDKLGGRELLIESFKNIFLGLQSIVKPIGDAFDDIFDKLTPKELFSAIEGFHKLTAKFRTFLIGSKEGNKILGNIKSTFKGLFAAVDIVAKVVGGALSAGFKVFSKVLGFIAPKVLAITGRAGDAVAKFREWLLESGRLTEIFKAFGSGIKAGIAKIGEWISAFMKLPVVQENIERFKNAFSETFGEGFARIQDFITRFKSLDSLSLENITGLFSYFKEHVLGYFVNMDDPFAKIKEAAKQFKTSIVQYFESASEKFTGLKQTVIDFVTAIKEKIGDNLGSILAIGVLISFLFLVKKIKDAVETLAKPFDMVEDLFDNIGGAFKAFGQNIKAKSMQSIATSIAILAGSVALLALLPANQVWSAVGAIAVLTGVLVAVSFAMGKIQNTGDFGKLSASLAGLAGAVLLLALAAKAMGMVEWESLGKCGAVLAVLIGSLALMSKLNISGSGFSGFGRTIMQLSTSLLILGAAIGILGSMNKETLIQGGIAVGTFFSMMVGMMAATKLLAKDLPRFGTTMAALSASLLLISAATAILGNMKLGTLVQGGLAVAAFLGMMVGIMAATKLLAKDLPKFGSTMFGLSAALLIMAVSVKLLAGMDAETFVKGGAAILGFIGIMAVMMAATKLLSKNLLDATKIGVMMLSFAGALLILVGAVALLGFIDRENIDKAVGALAKISVMLGGLMVASKFAGNMKGIISMSIAVGILAAALAALSFVDAAKLQSATTALSVVMGMMAVLVASTHFVKAGIGPLIALSGMVLVLSVVLVMLSYLKVDDALANAAALSVLVLSLSAAATILGVINVAGAASAVGAFAVFVGGLIAVLALVGGIAQIPGLDWLISEGGTFLQQVGEALGQFIGGIVGGMGISMSASLPEIGTNLSTFMTNLTPFLDSVKKIDESTANSIDSLVSMLLKLTAASLLDAITSWITGGSSVTTFAEQLVTLGEKLVEFSTAIAPLSEDDTVKMENVATATEKLVDIANAVPETGGLKQKLAGVPDLVLFATGLTELGPAVATFITSITDVSEEDITKMSNIGTAVDKFVEIAGKVPAEGGLAQAIAGTPSLTTFATGLATLGTSINTFNTTVTSVSEEDATKMSSIGSAIDSFVEIAGKVPAEGGLAQAIAGAPSLATFATELTTFGASVASFTGSVNTVSDEDITKMSSIGKAAKTLVGVATSLGEYSDRTWFNTSLTEFAGELATFGSKMSDFSGSVASVDSDKISVVTATARSLMRLAKSLNETNTGSLVTFGDNLYWFGEGLYDLSEDLAEVSTSKISSAITQVERLAALTTTVSAADFSSLSGFGEALGSLGDTGVSKFVSAFEDSYDKVVTAGNKMITALIKGVGDSESKVKTTFIAIAKDAANALRDAYSSFESAGKYLVSGFANGISANAYKAKAKARAMARAAANAAEDELDINSPSKVGYGIGDFFGLGFVNALSDYSDKTYRAGAEIAESAKFGLSSAVSKVSELLENGIDDQPTIRPVLDLSDVSAGASSINGMFGMRPSVGVLSNINAVNSMMNRNQNGGNDDVVSAIEDLGRKLNNRTGDTYNFGGISYNNGDEISDAVATLVRAIKVEGRT